MTPGYFEGLEGDPDQHTKLMLSHRAVTAIWPHNLRDREVLLGISYRGTVVNNERVKVGHSV